MIVPTAEIVTYLGLGASLTAADHALLTLLQPDVEVDCVDYVGGDIEQTTRTFLLPAHDGATTGVGRFELSGNTAVFTQVGIAGRILQLPTPALRSISALHSSTAQVFDATTLLTGGRTNDYYIDESESGISQSAQVIRVGTTWPSQRRSVQVACTVGWTAAELDGRYSFIKRAVLIAIVNAFKEAKSRQSAGGPVTSRRLGDAAWTYDLKGMDFTDSLPAKTAKRLQSIRVMAY